MADEPKEHWRPDASRRQVPYDRDASQQNDILIYLRSVCPKSVFPKTRPTGSAASGTPGIAVNAKYDVAVRSGWELHKGKRW